MRSKGGDQIIQLIHVINKCTQTYCILNSSEHTIHSRVCELLTSQEKFKLSDGRMLYIELDTLGFTSIVFDESDCTTLLHSV